VLVETAVQEQAMELMAANSQFASILASGGGGGAKEILARRRGVEVRVAVVVGIAMFHWRKWKYSF
jgi:hypothetical protein